MMALLNNTYKIFNNIEKAKSLAEELNKSDEEGWTYIVSTNPDPNGPKTAIIKIFDADGEFISKL
jgi:hypothetical protein